MSRLPLTITLSTQVAGATGSVTPGGVIGVWDRGSEVTTLCFGRHGDEPSDPAVDRNTVYDVASLTKAVVSSTVLMQLIAEGRIELETPARALLPELVGRGSDAITIGQLAGHAAGLPAHVEFFRRIWAGERARADSRREALVRMAGSTPLTHAPGSAACYSDLGYILLAAALERAGGARIDVLFQSRVGQPLGMQTSFFVDTEAGSTGAPPGVDIAPTELCPVRGRLRGEVHDENAHSGGGICGHAGLFSTVDDLARLALELCDAVAGSGSVLPGDVARLLMGSSAAPDTTWRHGWDSPSPIPGMSHAGDRWPASGVGHLGFTGTSLWLAPDAGRFVIMLTNRVYYTRDKAPIKALRRAVMDHVTDALDV